MATSASEKFRLSVPVGSLIPVIVDSPISGFTYSIPSAGTVKGPWKASDSCAIPAGHKLTGTSPDLTGGVYLRGSTTSGGSLGGTNTKYICVCTHCPASSPVGSFAPMHCHTFRFDDHSWDHTHCGGAYWAMAYIGSNCLYQLSASCTMAYCYRATATGFSRTLSTSGTSPGSSRIYCDTGSGNVTAYHSMTCAYYYWYDTMGPIDSSAHNSISWNASGNNEPAYITARYLIKVK